MGVRQYRTARDAQWVKFVGAGHIELHLSHGDRVHDAPHGLVRCGATRCGVRTGRIRVCACGTSGAIPEDSCTSKPTRSRIGAALPGDGARIELPELTRTRGRL